MANNIDQFRGGPFFGGDNLARANQIVDRVNVIGGTSGGSGDGADVHVSIGANGVVVSRPISYALEPSWWGVIVTAGPRGADKDPDYTDARYWVQRLLQQVVKRPSSGDIYQFRRKKQVEVSDPSTPIDAQPKLTGQMAIETVFNVAEHDRIDDATTPAETHNLAEGTIVRVSPTAFYDSDGKPHVTYVMNVGQGHGQLVPLNLTYYDGSDGNNTTAPSFRYTATYRYSGKAFGSGPLTPEVPRDLGSFNHASKGEGFIDGSGNAVLWKSYETYTVQGC